MASSCGWAWQGERHTGVSLGVGGPKALTAAVWGIRSAGVGVFTVMSFRSHACAVAPKALALGGKHKAQRVSVGWTGLAGGGSTQDWPVTTVQQGHCHCHWYRHSRGAGSGGAGQRRTHLVDPRTTWSAAPEPAHEDRGGDNACVWVAAPCEVNFVVWVEQRSRSSKSSGMARRTILVLTCCGRAIRGPGVQKKPSSKF